MDKCLNHRCNLHDNSEDNNCMNFKEIIDCDCRITRDPNVSSSVPLSVGLDGPTVKLSEIIELIDDYCKLHPTKDGAMFEAGFHQAGQGLIELLKAKYRKAD